MSTRRGNMRNPPGRTNREQAANRDECLPDGGDCEPAARRRVHRRYARAGGRRLVAAQVYAIPQDPPRADVPAVRLADYEGLYSLSAATRQTIRRRQPKVYAR